MTAARLAWRLLRAGGRRGLATVALTAVGLAVTTALLVLTVGAWSGFDARADRTQWRVPAASAAPADAPALQRLTTSAYDGRPVVVVDLAATGTATDRLPVPPGLDGFPAPGEAFLSPALADLVAAHPDELGGRFPAATGGLGDAALSHPDELVAVVGHEPGDPVMTAPAWEDQRRSGAYAGPVAVDDLDGRALADGQTAQYRSLAVIAAVLLVVPLLVLAGAAARLGLARRDQRFAALRLAGATPGQVLATTAAESAVIALVGAVAGLAVALLVVPVVAAVPVGGGRWFTGDLVPPAPVLAGLVAGVVVLAVASSTVALRRVLASPLGVAAAQTPPRMSILRVVVFVALVVGFLRYSEQSGASTTTLVLVFAGVFGALSVVGPWVVGVLGAVVVRRSTTAAALLAGRRMLDDPRGSWRVVGAVAMTGFVAGTLALFPTGGGDLVWGSPDRLDVALPAAADGASSAAAPDDVAADLRDALAVAGVEARVDGPGDDRGALLFLRLDDQPASFVGVTVPGSALDLETARTVVAQVAPTSVAATGADIVIDERRFAADFRTASVLVLAVSFLIAMASAGITSAAAVLDRRRTYRQLALVGVPLRVLDRARMLETQLPLLLLTIGSTVTGVVVAAPLTRLGMNADGLDVTGVLLLAGCLVLGLLGVRAASGASRPLLARVAADPASASD